MTVNIRIKNDIRYGDFDIDGIKGRFPSQAITSTNLNHAKEFDNPNFDFKTKIVEIAEFFPKKLVNDTDYREYRIKTVSKIIEENSGKLCLFTIRGARSNSYKFTKNANESLIDFQKECDFKFIKVFFKYVKSAKEGSAYYRKLIPKGKHFVASVDENMSHAAFRALYLECYRKYKDQIITFFGRKPSKSTKKIHNKLNFQFIAKRKDDRILRLISFTSKSIGGVVSSLVYNFFRFDTYSFMTRRGRQDIEEYDLMALNGFVYVQLTKNTKLICPITGKNLYVSSKEFERKLNKSSLPVSVHDIVRLNESFKILHEEYTREQLEKILDYRVF